MCHRKKTANTKFLKFCSDVPFSICKIFKPKKSGVTVDYFLLQGAKPDSGCFKNRYFSTLLPVDPYLIIYEKLSQFNIDLLYAVCQGSLDLNKNCFERSYSKYISYNENRYNLWQPFFKMAASKMATVSNQVPRVRGPYFGHDLTSDIVIISPCFHANWPLKL